MSNTENVATLYAKYDKYGHLRHDPVYRKLRDLLDLVKEKNVQAEIIEEVENAIILAERKSAYMEKHCSPESDTLREIRITTVGTDWKKTKEEGLVEQVKLVAMLTGKTEGEFLKHLVSMQRAKRVLDVGMFTGYIALTMAEALPPDGVVVTCDIEPYLKEICRKRFDQTSHGHKIDIRIGDAVKTLMSLADGGEKFDFIFIDADKENYCNYYNAVMDHGLLATNGTLVFDNAFRGGLSYTEQGEPVDALNRLVENDSRMRRVRWSRCHCRMLIGPLGAPDCHQLNN